ncbi:MAG TPA: sulfotransferase [Gaiellaceae bacterium]
MSEPDVKVLFLAGWGRSGTTILDNVLGEIDGFFSVGELYHLWGRGLVQERRCGCGVPPRRCETWQAILARAFDQGAPDGERIHRLALTCTRTRHLLAHVRRRCDAPDEYREALGRLYRAIPEVTGSRVVVDSTKHPAYAAVLGDVPGIDLRIVHVVRDPRAVAYSWIRKKVQLDEARPRYMRSHGAFYSGLMWDLLNVTTERLWRRSGAPYLLVRYEDFVRNPRASVRRVVDFAGEPEAPLPFRSGSSVVLGGNHTISGNPSRFQTGLVEIQPDDEWRKRMRRRDVWVSTGSTFPLLRRFGYPIRIRATG